MELQIKIRDLRLEQEAPGADQRVVVEGSLPEGESVSATLLDGPTAHLVIQILTRAGPEILRARLAASTSPPWVCMSCAQETLNGVWRLQVRDGTSISALCEHVRAAVFASERGQPMLEGFPPYQGEG